MTEQTDYRAPAGEDDAVADVTQIRVNRVERRRAKIAAELDRNRDGGHRIPTWAHGRRALPGDRDGIRRCRDLLSTGVSRSVRRSRRVPAVVSGRGGGARGAARRPAAAPATK